MEYVANEKQTLLALLIKEAPESPKTRIRGWIRDGRVCVNGRVVMKEMKEVDTGSVVTVGRKKKFLGDDLEVLYEDQDVVVVNKPAGLLSVDTDDGLDKSVHRLLKRQPHVKKVYPVHRLDRETSGILVFTYTERAREHLKEQFFNRTIGRTYYAVVEGKMEEKSGTWESNLLEDERLYVSSVAHGGKHAITHFVVEKAMPRFTLLKVNLETGRKHQIRVHCKDAGHPVVGDAKYGNDISPFHRLGLHAASLEFVHPVKNKKISFKVPTPSCFLSLFPQ